MLVPDGTGPGLMWALRTQSRSPTHPPKKFLKNPHIPLSLIILGTWSGSHDHILELRRVRLREMTGLGSYNHHWWSGLGNLALSTPAPMSTAYLSFSLYSWLSLGPLKGCHCTSLNMFCMVEGEEGNADKMILITQQCGVCQWPSCKCFTRAELKLPSL